MTAGFKISRRFFGELMLVGLGVGYLLGPSGAMTMGGQSQALKERNFRLIKTNGIRLRTVVEGSGPLVILLHGFPYGWYLWRDTRKYQNMKLNQPSLLIGGRKELSEETPIVKGMSQWLTDLRGTLMIDGAGHSIPMERPAEVNKALLRFLSSLK